MDWKILASELISSLLSAILKLKGTRYCGHLKDYGILGNVGVMLSGRGLCPTDTLRGSTACLTNVCSKVNVEHAVLMEGNKSSTPWAELRLFVIEFGLPLLLSRGSWSGHNGQAER